MPLTPDARAANLDAILARAPALPVLVIERSDDAVPLARTLVEAGLPVPEVTMRTEAALQAIRAIAAEVPDAIVGAGTVLDAATFAAVGDAGAAFAIAPGATEALYDAADASPVPFLPGIASASELMRGLERGHRRFKFFPAEASGGISALRGFAGPFPQVRFCPTGGIDARTAPSYLALRNVVTVGGSWMVPSDALAARDWNRIGVLARECAALRPRN